MLVGVKKEKGREDGKKRTTPKQFGAPSGISLDPGFRGCALAFCEIRYFT